MLKMRVGFSMNKKRRKHLWIAAAAAALVLAVACLYLMVAQKNVPPDNNTLSGVGRLVGMAVA